MVAHRGPASRAAHVSPRHLLGLRIAPALFSRAVLRTIPRGVLGTRHKDKRRERCLAHLLSFSPVAVLGCSTLLTRCPSCPPRRRHARRRALQWTESLPAFGIIAGAVALSGFGLDMVHKLFHDKVGTRPVLGLWIAPSSTCHLHPLPVLRRRLATLASLVPDPPP